MGSDVRVAMGESWEMPAQLVPPAVLRDTHRASRRFVQGEEAARLGGGGGVRTADGVLICVVCTVVSRATSFDELEFRARATSAPLGLTKKSTCAV